MANKSPQLAPMTPQPITAAVLISFAADLRPNIQVNCIGPTITYTPMMVGILPPDENVRNGIAGTLPAQRIGYESDVVGPAIFLASAASDMITAASIYPDGGLVATS